MTDEQTFDVCIVGGGPAGLQAAIYGASEGRSIVVFEAYRFGGQIRRSPQIENLMGHVNVSGKELTDSAVDQALSFGAHLYEGTKVTDVDRNEDGTFTVYTDGDMVVRAYAIIIAIGMEFKVVKFAGFDSPNVEYGPYFEDMTTLQKNVVVVGGANSAAQYALSLADLGVNVTMIVRSGLNTSQYLTDRIHAHSNIRLIVGCEVASFNGKNLLTTNGKRIRCECVKVFAGSVPSQVSFVPTTETGHIPNDDLAVMDGIFVAGDVRDGGMARVASAMGDGGRAYALSSRYITKRFGRSN